VSEIELEKSLKQIVCEKIVKIRCRWGSMAEACQVRRIEPSWICSRRTCDAG
jgi:hypothetical protein